ncbi:MAG: hypothetical protein WD208_13530 [Dehalococcoidia bacterium]
MTNIEDPFEDASADVMPTIEAPEIQPDDFLGMQHVRADPATEESRPHRDNSAAVQHDMVQRANDPQSAAPGAPGTNDSNAENVDAFATPSSAPAPAPRDDITPSAPRIIQPVQRELSERLANSTEQPANLESINVVDARRDASSQPAARDTNADLGEPGQHPREQLVGPSDQRGDSLVARTGSDEASNRQAEDPWKVTEQIAQMLVPLTSGSDGRHGSAEPGLLSSQEDSTTLSIGSITVELTPPPAPPEQRAPRRRSSPRARSGSRSTAARSRNGFGLGQV